ncbi:GNAT family N-acetyltransferase [Litchfieldia alkalitelluris]|uniref:GNAT family N-acetyltransferase n=1 Tax=Litchfieldia alkalitelluris TaxID=304268 RepID=UPI000996EDBC
MINHIVEKELLPKMASDFIIECLAKNGTPRWTTEYFRKDSISIANKLGFKQLPNYDVYYLEFQQFLKNLKLYLMYQKAWIRINNHAFSFVFFRDLS